VTDWLYIAALKQPQAMATRGLGHDVEPATMGPLFQACMMKIHLNAMDEGQEWEEVGWRPATE